MSKKKVFIETATIDKINFLVVFKMMEGAWSIFSVLTEFFKQYFNLFSIFKARINGYFPN
ncbi:MAG: hypothetical protein SOW07_04515 [Helicobacter sp.]|nr:hypothetical protein [Helicobacter sp.]MDY2584895.1 hypothetical protein [Helicobacter sp.]